MIKRTKATFYVPTTPINHALVQYFPLLRLVEFYACSAKSIAQQAYCGDAFNDKACFKISHHSSFRGLQKLVSRNGLSLS